MEEGSSELLQLFDMNTDDLRGIAEFTHLVARERYPLFAHEVFQQFDCDLALSSWRHGHVGHLSMYKLHENTRRDYQGFKPDNYIIISHSGGKIKGT